MSEADSKRVPIAVLFGIFCLLTGLAQFLYSFLAFASVVFVDVLGIGLTIGASAFAAVPEEPFEIPYARDLANTISSVGMVFAIVLLVSGSRSFYRRQLPRIGAIACCVIGLSLAGLHYMNSLSYPAWVYVGIVLVLSCLILGDWRIVALNKSSELAPSETQG